MKAVMKSKESFGLLPGGFNVKYFEYSVRVETESMIKLCAIYRKLRDLKREKI